MLFLKNLFYRNKFHTTSILKNSLLVLPFISASIFYSRNHTNKMMLRTNRPEKMNQNFVTGKKIRFLFGFHLNVYNLNFFRSYLPKIKRYPSFFLEKRNRFFSSGFPYRFTLSEGIGVD